MYNFGLIPSLYNILYLWYYLVMDIDSGKLKQKLIKKLNDSNIFTSKMLEHQRAVGDGIESIIRENITYFFGDVKNSQQSKSQKSMEDFSFYKNKDYYAVDVKTLNLDGDFTMPNLTGIKGLTKFYEVETNHFCLLVVEYRVKDKKLLIENIIFTKLEHIMWDTLQLVHFQG